MWDEAPEPHFLLKTFFNLPQHLRYLTPSFCDLPFVRLQPRLAPPFHCICTLNFSHSVLFYPEDGNVNDYQVTWSHMPENWNPYIGRCGDLEWGGSHAVCAFWCKPVEICRLFSGREPVLHTELYIAPMSYACAVCWNVKTRKFLLFICGDRRCCLGGMVSSFIDATPRFTPTTLRRGVTFVWRVCHSRASVASFASHSTVESFRQGVT
jgi:hypothetical protein